MDQILVEPVDTPRLSRENVVAYWRLVAVHYYTKPC